MDNDQMTGYLGHMVMCGRVKYYDGENHCNWVKKWRECFIYPRSLRLATPLELFRKNSSNDFYFMCNCV